MLGRKLGLIIFVIAVVGLGLFLTRPWSDYNPLKMNSLFSESKRVENLRNMDQIFPSRTIKAGTKPFRFKADYKPLNVQYRFRGDERNLDEFLDRVVGTGLLVIKNDRLVHERYMQGSDEETRFTSWSVAKSFVSTLVGIALGDGLIRSLDDDITDYVPELKGTGYDGVPIKHVLQMSSGVEFDETYGNRFSDIQQFFWKVFIFGKRADEVMTLYPKAQPSGTEHHYISIDTQALAMMLRRLYDKPLANLLSERIWQPLGMEGDAYWNIDKESEDGMEIAFCCINARLRDYAKLGRLYLNQGRWNGKQIVPKGWVMEATTPGAPHLEPGVSPHNYGPRGYQYQWWIPENYKREYFASGVWGQFIYVSEPDNLIIVRTSVDPDYRPNMEETIVVFRAIRDALR